MTEQHDQSAPAAVKITFRDLLGPIAIILAGLMVSASILWSGRLPPKLAAQQTAAVTQPAEPAQPPPPDADIARVNLQGEPFIGNANAPVVMAYWFDYQCPFCKQNEESAFPQLIKDYVDAGKLKIVFKDFQFLGPDSQTAGLAARAIWDAAPDKFRDWHKAMFDHQGRENSGWATKDNVVAITKAISGIDVAKVEELMTNRAANYNKAMEADMTEGTAMGVNGTPAMLMGKQMISGAVPYSQLKGAVDQMLTAK